VQNLATYHPARHNGQPCAADSQGATWAPETRDGTRRPAPQSSGGNTTSPSTATLGKCAQQEPSRHAAPLLARLLGRGAFLILVFVASHSTSRWSEQNGRLCGNFGRNWRPLGFDRLALPRAPSPARGGPAPSGTRKKRRDSGAPRPSNSEGQIERSGPAGDGSHAGSRPLRQPGGNEKSLKVAFGTSCGCRSLESQLVKLFREAVLRLLERPGRRDA